MSDARIDPKLLARSSPAGLAWYASGGRDGSPSWIPATHLLMLSQKLVDVATGRCPRLMVFMPPRHGKSELISKYTPAWFLGRFPDRKVMLTSYADTFAASWGRRARDVFSDVAPDLFGKRVNPESAGGQHWEVSGHEGIMVTAGVGGGLTGKGAHLLIIDDPIKNSDEAQSETTREKHHDWWKSTARTRLQPGGAVVLVMTRWHEDDLAGRLLGDALEDGDQWEVLCLEGIAEESHPLRSGADPLGRAPGDALWPEMFPAEELERTRRAMGNYWFTAMYQQRPAPADGMLFKRTNFRYFTKSDSGVVTLHRDEGDYIFDPAYGTKFCTVDVAASEKTESDYTVVSTWVVTPHKDLLLWDRQRVQFQGPDVKLLIRRVFFEQKPALIGIERLGHGLHIIQELVREGMPIVRLEPDTDKISRALPACARYEEHRIYHPTGEAWVRDEWETELLAFPNAAHDDQVDTVAYAALQLPLIGVGGGIHRGDRGIAARTGKTLTGGLLSDVL